VSGYLFYVDKVGSQARCNIFKYTAGVFAAVGVSVNLTIANGDVFRFEASGATLTGYQNDTQIVQVPSDTSYSSGRAAIEVYPTVALTDAQVTAFSCGGFDLAVVESRMLMSVP
jgi:hypothetical protein